MMKQVIYALGVVSASLMGFTVAAESQSTDDVIELKSVRGYHIGGERVTLTGLPTEEVRYTPSAPVITSDPNGDYQVGQLYVQHFELASPSAKYPLLLWHGGGLTGVTWEETPDGRPGWHDFFMRAGHDTYVSDAVERGRATWARYPEINPGPPQHRTINDAWGLFRFGPDGGYATEVSEREVYPDQQFPWEAADQFAKQFTPRWTTSDEWTQNAYDELVQHACPCVILAHSQSGNFALTAAQNAPDKVMAVILIEPSGAPDPTEHDPVNVKDIPHLVVWGDYIDQSETWQNFRATIETYTTALEAAGGASDVIDLPAMDIHGNSHMIMMDKNSDQVARLIQDWMTEQDLME